MSLTLTRDELVELTGKSQPARMCVWLTARGWHFEPPARRGDVPKVDRAYYTAKMSGQQPGAPSRRVEPCFDFMLGGSAA